MHSLNLRLLPLAVLAVLVGSFGGTPANAFDYSGGLTGEQCDLLDAGCNGSSLFVGVDVVDASTGTYNITLILDTSGYYGAEDGVVQAGVKVFSDYDVVTAYSGPDQTVAPYSWSNPVEAAVSSNNVPCGGGGDSGFLCTSGYVNVANPDQYVWEFTVTGGTLLSDISDWGVGFQYCDESTYTSDTGPGCKGKLISAPVVPEPSAALVFGLALLVAAPRMRRR